MKGLQLRFFPYDLELKHVFTVSVHSRTSTPVMLVEIEFEGVVGYGEAAMPPYLGETQETATRFLELLKLEQFKDPFQLDDILAYVAAVAPNNNAAKAAVDIALHDLVGKLLNSPLYKIWGYDKEKTPVTSFTIGIDNAEVVQQKTREASPYKLLKVKVGLDNDKEMIGAIRSVTDTPICVDVNQGWKDKYQALDMIEWLATQNVEFVEQPMPKEQEANMAWLTAHSPLPTVADEAVQRLEDIPRLQGQYTAINVKLMKATGLREAHKMLLLSKALGMKSMLGCMTETSCAITAAAQLSSQVDWADLDGNLLITNDVFEGATIRDGKVVLTDLPGIGVQKIKK